MTRSRRLVLCASLGFIAFIACDGGGESNESATGSDAPPALSESAAVVIERGVTATRAEERRAALADSIKDETVPAPLLANGASLEVDVTTFERIDDDFATVDAAVVGGPSAGTRRLYLVWQRGAWRLLSVDATP